MYRATQVFWGYFRSPFLCKIEAMELPLFEEINFIKWDVISIKKVLERSKVGKCPCYTVLPEASLKDSEIFITDLEEALKTTFIHPKFPYPYYLVTPLPIKSDFFPLIEKEEYLPRFFSINKKAPSVRESELLTRINILRDKIKATSLYREAAVTKEYSSKAKRLKELADMANFYEKMEEEL